MILHHCHRYCFILLFSIVFISTKTSAKTMHSLTDGYWNNASIWSGNDVPKDGDSVYIHHQVLATGDTLLLRDFYLNITDSGCLCGERTHIIFDESILINSGHMAFISLLLQNNTTGLSSGVLLLANFVKATSNSQMTITSGGITITPENDLTCRCITDSSGTDTTGGIDTISTILLLDFEFEMDLTSDTAILCPGDSISINRSAALQYLWSTGDTTRFIQPDTDGWYALTLSNDKESVTDSLFVLIQTPFSYLFPNILTPNDDNINEAIIITEQEAAISDFRVFNRWGRLVYQFTPSNDLELSGEIHFPASNVNITDGMYFYIAEVQDLCNESNHFQRGWILISR